jgi:DNA-binding response OmpR family regulator
MNDKAQSGTILLVEDDPSIAAALTEVLELNGYSVWHAEGGASARKALVEKGKPDLIILDLILPDVDGLVLCADLKSIAPAPIIICSGTTRKRDAAVGLRLGADDFIAKPFDIYEMEARIAAIMRRTQYARAEHEPEPAPTSQVSAMADTLHVGDLLIERTRHRVSLAGEPIQLTPIEYRLLTALASRPDDVLSRDELAQLVWGYQDASVGRTIDVHIRRLRVKLSSAKTPPPPIISVRGFGYKITAEVGRPVSLVS